ncbi:MAG TPA: DUF3078 domain-containing protein [Chitinophagaceae bacterium]
MPSTCLYTPVTFVIAFLLFLQPETLSAQQTVFIPKRIGAKKVSSLDSNGWKSTGLFILNVNQSAQSDWGSGGENFMIGINCIINKAVHHRKNKYTFDMYADLELGVVEATSFKRFRKTTDRFDMTAELEHSIGTKGHFNYALLGNINTQLFEGHNYTKDDHPKISGLLSPGKFLLSFGIDYKNTNRDNYFSLFISPATIRWVTKIDRDFYTVTKFGVDSSQKVNTEIGAYLSVHYNAKLSKTANLISRLDLFSNYKRKPRNVDVLLNNVLTISINKFLAGTFLFDILYDHDYKKRTQVQEVTGLGLRLKL